MNIRSIFLGMLLIAVSQVKGQSLSLIWETDTMLAKPESAVYDRDRQVIYVSNVNGEYRTKDGNGFISKITLDGKIEKLKWIDSLNSPQGLALHGNNLYAADVDEVVKMDVKAGKVVSVYKADSAIFLNDAACDRSGAVYVSDCMANKIYKLKNGKLFVWSNNPLLKMVNGLFCGKNKLFALSMGSNKGYVINSRTRAFTPFFDGIKNLDGIVSDGEKGFFVSGAWQGEVYHIDGSGVKILVLDLGAEKVIAADIEYIPEKKMLLVPTLNKTIRAYRWDK